MARRELRKWAEAPGLGFHPGERAGVRRQESLVARQDESAHAGLEFVREGLKFVGLRDDLVGVGDPAGLVDGLAQPPQRERRDGRDERE